MSVAPDAAPSSRNPMEDFSEEELRIFVAEARKANPKLYIGNDSEVAEKLLQDGGHILLEEESDYHKQWYAEADRVRTLDDFNGFFRKLVGNDTRHFEHDYGTICHAMAALALAATRAADHTGTGGITGFQHGAITWMLIRAWTGEKGPMKMLRYEDMLFPQSADKFEKIVTKDVWEFLQEQAKAKLAEAAANTEGRVMGAHPMVLAHWQAIAGGQVPFGYVVKDKDEK